MKRLVRQASYDLLYTVPLAILISMVGLTYTYVNQSYHKYVCILTVVFSVAVSIVRLEWKKIRYGVCITSVILAVIVVTQIVRGGKFPAGLNINWFFWTITFSIIVSICTMFIQKSNIVKHLTLIAGGIIAGYFLLEKIWVYKSAIAAFMFIACIIVTEDIQKKWNKTGIKDEKSHVVSVAPFVVIVFLAIVFCPAPSKPINWDFLVDFAYDAINALGMENENMPFWDEYANVGFTNHGGFAARLENNDDEVMSVVYVKDNIQCIYLSGIYFEDFSGVDWTTDIDPDDVAAPYSYPNSEDMDVVNSKRTMDLLQTKFAVNNYSALQGSEYFIPIPISIRYTEIASKYVFNPLKVSYEESSFDTVLNEYSDSIRSQKPIGNSNMSLNMTYYYCDNESGFFDELVNNAEDITAEKWGNYVETQPYPLSTVSYEDFLDYKQSIYDDYCTSYGISDKLKIMLDRMFEDCDSDYDRMKCLENYFAEMDYSLTPGKIPKEVDTPEEFLDYLIFEKREGYCAYYATAFVLIAREYGLPARYVQGYRIAGDVSFHTVRENMAHAWPEVYFDNVGWIQFEPTPGFAVWSYYREDSDDSDSITAQYDTEDVGRISDEQISISENEYNFESDNLTSTSYDEEEDLNESDSADVTASADNTDYAVQDLSANEVSVSPATDSDDSAADNDDSTPEFDKETDNNESNYDNKDSVLNEGVLIAICCVCGVFAMIVIGFMTNRIILYRSFKKMSANDKLYTMYTRSMKILEFLGMPAAESETICEYMHRISGNLPETIPDFMYTYETVIYSDEAVTEEMLDKALNANAELDTMLKNKSIKYRLLSMLMIKYK